jgi:hypothetical protein
MQTRKKLKIDFDKLEDPQPHQKQLEPEVDTFFKELFDEEDE